jgi:hypothetical protein
MGSGGRLTWFLLLCALLLAGVLARQLAERTLEETPPAAAGAVTSADPSPLPPEAVFDPPARAAFDEILERPLFSEDRRPPPEPEQPVAAPAPMMPVRLQLLGVATTGDVAVALVRDLTTQELLRLSEGMVHQGWTVSALEPGRAVLKRGEQTQELDLELDTTRRPVRRTTVPRRTQ